MEILIVNFALDEMTDAEYRAMCDQIAPAFAVVPGLQSKVWLADESSGVYGGVYTFESTEALEAYLASDLCAQAAATPGLGTFSILTFGVLAAPTGVTHGLAVAAA